MTTETETAVACPKCGGNMWDNRDSKTNPKAPDYKCRNRGCDGVIWPPKTPAGRKLAYNGTDAPPARTPQPTTLGGAMPWENQETGAPPIVAASVMTTGDTLDAQFAVYSRCMDKARTEIVRAGIDKLGGDVAGAVVAAAATLFIQASKR